MKKSLVSFSFDKAKAGRILKKYIEDSPYSQRQVAPLIGTTDDMLSNVVRGQNKEISFERVFKICTITGHSICEFQREMLDGEDIDFADQVNSVCFADTSADFAAHSVPHGVTAHQTEVVAKKTEIIEEGNPLFKSLGPDVFSFLRSDRAEQDQRTNEIHDAYIKHLIDQYHDQIQHYEQHISMLNKEHELRIEDIKASHNRVVEYLKAENKRLQKWVLRLGVALGIETLAVIFVFVIDSINQNVGWIRSFMPSVSNGFFDSIWS